MTRSFSTSICLVLAQGVCKPVTENCRTLKFSTQGFEQE
jgi:hypothetical protein